jgi:bacterial/archaeal transporter family-2 protein
VNSFVVIALIVLVAGTLAGLQIPINSLLSSRVGSLEGAFVVHLVGLIFAAVALVFFSTGGLASWRNAPWYAYIGGIFGVLLVTALNFATPKIGVSATLVIFLVAQLIIGAIIGHFGFLETPVKPIDLAKLIGFVLLAFGAWLVVRPS